MGLSPEAEVALSQRIDRTDLVLLQNLLLDNNKNLEIFDSGHGNCLYLADANGSLIPILFESIPHQTIGFILNGFGPNHDGEADPDEHHSVDKSKAERAIKRDLNIDDEVDGIANNLDYFNHNFMDTMIKILETELIQDLVFEYAEKLPEGLSDEQIDDILLQFAAFTNILRKHKLRPAVDYIGDNLFIHFRNTDDNWYSTALLEDHDPVLGFILKRDDESNSQHSRRKSYIRKKYSKFITDEVGDVLTLNYENISYLLNNLDDSQVSSFDQAYPDTEAVQESFGVASYVPDMLNPLLAEQGIKAVIAQNEVTRSTDPELTVSTQKFPLVDLIFVDESVGTSLVVKPIDIFGWDAARFKGKNPDYSQTTIYRNVVGILVVPRETGLRERKDIARQAERQLNRVYPLSSGPKVLIVDEDLIDLWSETGQIIPTEEEIEQIEEERSPKKSYDYGSPEVLKRKKITSVEVFFFEQENSFIGGPHATFVVTYEGGLKHAVAVDPGWIFSKVPGWSAIGAGPQYIDGIMPLLKAGMLDRIRRLYRLDLLINSLNPDVIDGVLNLVRGSTKKRNFYSNEEFVALELYHRLGEDGFVSLMWERMREYMQKIGTNGSKGLSMVLNYLREREKLLYKQKTYHMGLALTHAHQDHAIGSSWVRDEVPRIMSPITRVLLLADHKLANAWYVQDTAARKMRELPKVGSAYQVAEYPWEIAEDGQEIQIAENIFLTGHEVYHSIPGSMGFVIEARKGRQRYSMAYGGDYRDGRFFKALGNHRKVDLLVMEGTNPPGVKKDSANQNEKEVTENFKKKIAEAKEAGALLIADVVKNNFERLTALVKEAIKRGQTVVISPKIALRVFLLTVLMNQGYDLDIELPDLNHQAIFIWKRDMMTYDTIEKQMFEKYGLMDKNGISANHDKVVLIRDSSEHVEKISKIGGRVMWVRSAYAAYDEMARNANNHMRKIAKENGWELTFEGFHATGHGPLYPSDHPNAEGGILDELSSNPHAENIAVVHTQKRPAVHEAIKSYPNLADIPLVTDFKNPRSRILLSK